MSVDEAWERAELMPGEQPPVVGETMSFGPMFSGVGMSCGRVERVSGQSVWYSQHTEQWSDGVQRWEFHPTVSRSGLERLRRRTV